jgi:hypothetical protein
MSEDQIVATTNCVNVRFAGTGLDVDVVPVLYEGEPNDVGCLVSKDDGTKLRTSVRQNCRRCCPIGTPSARHSLAGRVSTTRGEAQSRGTLTVRHLSPWARLREPLVVPGGIGRNPGTSDLPARARRQQEFGYEVEVVEGEVNAASVVDPSQSIAAAVY